MRSVVKTVADAMRTSVEMGMWRVLRGPLRQYVWGRGNREQGTAGHAAKGRHCERPSRARSTRPPSPNSGGGLFVVPAKRGISCAELAMALSLDRATDP